MDQPQDVRLASIYRDQFVDLVMVDLDLAMMNELLLQTVAGRECRVAAFLLLI